MRFALYALSMLLMGYARGATIAPMARPSTARVLRMRLERSRRGWSQTRLSALTGIAQSDLSAIETGRRPAGPDRRRRLASVFGVSEADLFVEVKA
jgi:plasmid maintenance system antidote protein VapI